MSKRDVFVFIIRRFIKEAYKIIKIIIYRTFERLFHAQFAFPPRLDREKYNNLPPTNNKSLIHRAAITNGETHNGAYISLRLNFHCEDYELISRPCSSYMNQCVTCYRRTFYYVHMKSRKHCIAYIYRYTNYTKYRVIYAPMLLSWNNKSLVQLREFEYG